MSQTTEALKGQTWQQLKAVKHVLLEYTEIMEMNEI